MALGYCSSRETLFKLLTFVFSRLSNAGNYGPCLMGMPRIGVFWNKVFTLLRQMTGVSISSSPRVALLSEPLQKVFILLAAMLTIARCWKKTYVHASQLRQKVSWVMTHEKLTRIIQDFQKHFEKIWRQWADYMHIDL